MQDYDEQLHALLAQCARKKKLEAAAAELRRQRDSYSARAQELKQRFQEEQADVDRLEGRSLSAFFYQVIGKKDEKLTQEKEEAYAARVKYDAVARELAGIAEDLRSCEAELDSLRDCERSYAAVLQEKTQAIKTAGGAAAEKIFNLEARAAYLESQGRELAEALSAGQAALATADQIADSLGSAEGWGTWDVVGGSVFADMAKHSHLDSAQASVETLQSQLRRFKTELADVTIDADFQVNIDGFLRVADYIFDSIFVDWSVLSHIHQCQEQVQNTRYQICAVLDRLRDMDHQAKAQFESLRQEIEDLVAGTAI